MVVRYLVEQGADKDKAAVTGATPLIKAAVRGHAAVAECLLEHGCALDHADVRGLTALHLAVFFNKLEVVQRLLHYGATPDVQDNGGRTPAVEAARRGYHAVADAIRAEMTRRIRRMERLMALFCPRMSKTERRTSRDLFLRNL
jgi:ankyrin repeat protein